MTEVYYHQIEESTYDIEAQMPRTPPSTNKYGLGSIIFVIGGICYIVLSVGFIFGKSAPSALNNFD
jgi:hypothetical protein